MMSVQTIIRLERQVAVRAAFNEAEPYNPTSTLEVAGWKRLPIPNIGSYNPAGWRAVETETITKGGEESYAGKGIGSTKQWAIDILERDPQAGFAITSESQFLANITYFTPDPEAKGDTIEAGECWQCGRPVEKDEDSCPWCDAALEWCGLENYEPEPPETCDECGDELEPNGSCTYCETRPCPGCHQVTAGLEECEDCGWPNKSYDPDTDPNQLKLDLEV